jgi:hypothetical protein
MKRMLRSFLTWLLVLGSFTLCFGEESGEESKAKFPIGYPWSSWGEITETPVGHQETGLKIDGYAEQGVDWFKLGKMDWIFNSFIGIRGTGSSRKSDYWNNRVGPWAGLKFKKTLDLGGNNSATLSLGTRWEYYRYLPSGAPVRNDHRVTLFLEWAFDGDWKRKNNKGE